MTGTCWRHQRWLTVVIKRARVALLPSPPNCSRLAHEPNSHAKDTNMETILEEKMSISSQSRPGGKRREWLCGLLFPRKSASKLTPRTPNASKKCAPHPPRRKPPRRKPRKNSLSSSAAARTPFTGKACENDQLRLPSPPATSPMLSLQGFQIEKRRTTLAD